MKKFNKLTALIIALMMALSIMPIYADEDIDTFDEYDIHNQPVMGNIYDNYTLIGEAPVAGGEENNGETVKTPKIYADALAKLNAFGVVLGDLGGEGVTRAEFTGIVMRSIGLTDGIASKQYFYDVDTQHSYASYINAAYEMKYVSGSNGFFNPDDKITYNEAISVLIRVMGLDKKAEYIGGYPNGFVKTAKDADILDDIAVSDYTAPAVKGDIYVMLVNALTSESYMRIESISDEGITYSNKPVITMLEEHFGICESEGIVNAVGISNLLSDDSVGKDRVQIGDNVYKGVYEEYIDLIGYEVEYYYNKEERELVYACSITEEEDVIVLYGNSNLTFENNEYKYYTVDGKEKKVGIVDGASVLYNGTIATSDIENLYTPQNGTVTLINNDGNGKFDVVLIENYVDLIVGAIDITNQTVYDKYDGNLSVCFEDDGNDGNVMILNPQGKRTYAAFLNEEDVLSVKISGNKKCIEGVVSSGTVAGVIEKTQLSDEYIITVNGKDYVLTDECYERFDKYVKVGKEVSLYINILGKVAAIKDSADGGMKYGYVVDYIENSSLFDKGVGIKLLSEDGEFETYDLSDRCSIDGIKRDTFDKQMMALNNGLGIHKIIKYAVNENNEMTVIDTTYLEKSAEAEDGSLMRFESGNDFTTKLHYKASGNIADSFFWNANTKFFIYIPSATDEKSKYRVLPTAGAGIGNDKAYICAGYTDEHSFLAEAMVFQMDSVAGAVSSVDWSVVSEVIEGVNAEEEPTLYIETTSGAGINTVEIEKSEYEDLGYTIDKGDVIRYDAIEGKVLNGAIKKIFDYSDSAVTDTKSDGSAMGNTNSTNDEYSLRLGYVYDKIGDYFMLAPVNDKKELANFNKANGVVIGAPGANIAVVRKVGNNIEVSSGSVKDLKSYLGTKDSCSKVLVRYHYMMHRQIIIYDETV